MSRRSRCAGAGGRRTPAGRSVTLAGDDRARIPFALVGVLLLLGSATFAAGIASRSPPDAPATETAIERGFAAAQTDLRTAVRRATVAAARAPVLVRANTSYGRALDATNPFADALRARIYARTSERFAASTQRVDEVRVRSSLPPIDGAGDLANATDRVTLAEPRPGTLRVTVANVTVAATRDGRTLATAERDVTVTVRTPLLVVHRRVERYERRLNRGPSDGGGLGRRLTAKLGVVAWSRGAAQYQGVPIANVVSNRHVEVATNGALLSVQRSVFGRSDPTARRGVARATARTGLGDLASAAGVDGGGWVDVVLPSKPGEPPTDLPTRPPPQNGPDATLSRNASDAADRALYDLLAGEDGPNVSSIATREYTVSVRRYAAVRRVDDADPPTPPRPSSSAPDEAPAVANWTRISDVTTARFVVDAGDGPRPAIARDDHRLDGATRRVDRAVSRRAVWRRDGETSVTWANWTERYAVGVVVAGDHGPTKHAPPRPVDPVHERGGDLAGPNLVGVTDRAVDRLVVDAGGWDAVAADAVQGTLDAGAGDDESAGDAPDPAAPAEAETTVVGRQPPSLDRRLVADLGTLHDRVAATNVTATRMSLLADRNPPRELAHRLRDRKSTLVPVPETYDGVSERARIAVRRAYVDRIVAVLSERGEAVTRSRDELDDRVDEATGMGLDAVQATLDAARALDEPPRRRISGGAYGPLSLHVDGAPAYLTLGEVPQARVRATVDGPVRPLTARNLNVFTLPTDDVVQTLLDALFQRSGGRQVRLRTAAKTLRAADRTLAVSGNASLAPAVMTLRGEVARRTQTLGGRVAERLASETSLDRAESRTVVNAALARWEADLPARTLALVDGRAARAVAARASGRADTPDDALWRERVRVTLQHDVRAALTDTRLQVDAGTVEGTTDPVQSVVRKELAGYLAGRLRNATRAYVRGRLEDATPDRRRKKGGHPLAIPAGLPVTPVPGAWYATVNVWHVDVSGTYARFTVRARGVDDGGRLGTPVAYTRDGRAVGVDLTGDGHRERLGYASRVRFRTTAVVAVVVPPGGTGVGDVDGNMDERSKGWPRPTPRPPPANRTFAPFEGWFTSSGGPPDEVGSLNLTAAVNLATTRSRPAASNATIPRIATRRVPTARPTVTSNRQPIYPRGRRCSICSTNSDATSPD